MRVLVETSGELAVIEVSYASYDRDLKNNIEGLYLVDLDGDNWCIPLPEQQCNAICRQLLLSEYADLSSFGETKPLDDL